MNHENDKACTDASQSSTTKRTASPARDPRCLYCSCVHCTGGTPSLRGRAEGAPRAGGSGGVRPPPPSPSAPVQPHGRGQGAPASLPRLEGHHSHGGAPPSRPHPNLINSKASAPMTIALGAGAPTQILGTQTFHP